MPSRKKSRRRSSHTSRRLSNAKRKSTRRSPLKRSKKSHEIKDNLLKRYKSSRKSSRSPKAKSIFNRFFDKIFIINLKESTKRWKKVNSNFKKKGIKVERYDGIDGRCKDNKECAKKQKSFEKTYSVKYGTKIKNPRERLPASSLTLAHKLIYTEMVKQGWDQILICEDDVWLSPNIEKRFKESIKQLPDTWDMIYLGAGGQAGFNGISLRKTSKNKHLTDLAPHYDDKWYVHVKEDLRSPCYDDCEKYSKDFTLPGHIGGTWSVAISQKGAKKLLKIIGDKVGNHIDKIHPKAILDGKIEAYVFDPPIVWHEGGAIRPDSTIPWSW